MMEKSTKMKSNLTFSFHAKTIQNLQKHEELNNLITRRMKQMGMSKLFHAVPTVLAYVQTWLLKKKLGHNKVIGLS